MIAVQAICLKGIVSENVHLKEKALWLATNFCCTEVYTLEQ